MAFFKTLKTSFNNVFVDGIFYKFKKVKLTRNRSNWSLSDLKMPYSSCCLIKAAGSDVLYMVRSSDGGAQNLKKIYALTSSMVWTQLPDLPDYFYDNSDDDSASYRAILLASHNDRDLLFIPTSNGYRGNQIYRYQSIIGSWQKLGMTSVNVRYYCGLNTLTQGYIVFGVISGSNNTRVQIDKFNNQSFDHVGSIEKAFYSSGTSNLGTAVEHKGIVHFFAYQAQERIIYDCQFLNGISSSPTFVVVAVAASGTSSVENTPKGSFVDSEGVMHVYTKTTLYGYNDTTGMWYVVDTNYISDSYGIESVVSSWKDRKTYRAISASTNLYRMDNTYTIDFED